MTDRKRFGEWALTGDCGLANMTASFERKFGLSIEGRSCAGGAPNTVRHFLA